MNGSELTSNHHLRMNVVQIIDSLGTGGTEKMVCRLALQSRKMCVPFSVISLSDDSESDIAKEIRNAGGTVYNFPSKKLLDIKRVLQIRNLIKKQKFDLLHTYLTYSNIVGCLVGLLAGIPVICSLRNLGDAPMYYHPVRTLMETYCLNFVARKVMCNGYAIAEFHSRRVKTKTIEVIPNAVNVSPQMTAMERYEIRRELSIDPAQRLAFSAGRLIPLKGFSQLISAVEKIRAQIPDIGLVIAGDGPDMEYLTQQIETLGLSNLVKLLGYRKDVLRLMQISDVYVSASSSEGMSVAILEGMAAGLPVVATDVGDAARVVVEGTGIIIPKNDPGLIAEALISILNNKEDLRRMGTAAREHVRSSYSLEIWWERMIKLYEAALAED